MILVLAFEEKFLVLLCLVYCFYDWWVSSHWPICFIIACRIFTVRVLEFFIIVLEAALWALSCWTAWGTMLLNKLPLLKSWNNGMCWCTREFCSYPASAGNFWTSSKHYESYFSFQHAIACQLNITTYMHSLGLHWPTFQMCTLTPLNSGMPV